MLSLAAATTIALTAPRIPPPAYPPGCAAAAHPALWIALATGGAALIQSAMSLTPPTDLKPPR